MHIISKATSYLGHALHLQAAWELGVVWMDHASSCLYCDCYLQEARGAQERRQCLPKLSRTHLTPETLCI